MCNRRFAALLGVIGMMCSQECAEAQSASATPVTDMRLTGYATVSEPLHLHGQIDLIQDAPRYTQIRPSLFYRNRALEVGAGYAWVNYYEEPARVERRALLRMRLTQAAAYGSHYEQLNFVERWYAPGSSLRIGLRYAQNYWAGTRPVNERVQRYRFYEDLALKTSGNGGWAFDYARLWAMYEMPLGNARLAVGARVQQSRAGSGEPKNLTYGPQIQVTIGEH